MEKQGRKIRINLFFIIYLFICVYVCFNLNLFILIGG